ncbi:sigma-70 family RNA polymerase sigma factor [Streptomyces sp.]|uniref:sigma-70 family RNA polymerase sigma factor n=1 Tax=Streptomyces sp. TaxID=1931 RepID=UPI002D76BAA8|nr:sigma-70 family RNA polymerase sigma factor [Streptomyces sp.]HET6354245.1 sigma-70 family RNA polymerase sigma factor [Streptomyces sp.]
MEELYRRHRSAVLSYARTCCRDPHTAEDLVSEAFARTLQAVRSGGGPEAAWRPYLLTVVRRVAAEWAGTARRTELSADFEQWLGNLPDSPEAESSEERILRLEDNSLVIRAFRSLPERWQAVLWHTAVEEEPASKVAGLLGMGASGVGSLASRAREGLREAYLAAHVESALVSEECRRFSSLLGAAVRRSGRRPNKDLDRHLEQCQHCRHALTELTDLNERLGSALPTCLLLWGSSAYVAARMAEAGASAAGAASASGTLGGDLSPDGGTGWWPPAADSPLRSGAFAGGVVTALAVALLVLPMPFGDDGTESSPSQAAPAVTEVEHAPPVTVTATASQQTPSGRAEPAVHVSGTASGKPAEPSPTGAGLGTVTWSGTLRNAGINTKCVEPADAAVTRSVGTAIVQNTCDGSKDQVWQTVWSKNNKDYVRLRNAATGECIDYGAATYHSGATGKDIIDPAMCPCRTEGEGQLFRFDGGDGRYSVRAEQKDGRPWNPMQLGMLDWWEGGDPPPETNAPVVLILDYYNATRLRYLVEGR